MNDFSKLAGQTVDGWYYLTQDDTIQGSDLYLDGVWRRTMCPGDTPRFVNNGIPEEHINFARYRRRVAATQPSQPVAPCERCEELEEAIRRADDLRHEVSMLLNHGWHTESRDSTLCMLETYESARARVKIGGESVSD